MLAVLRSILLAELYEDLLYAGNIDKLFVVSKWYERGVLGISLNWD